MRQELFAREYVIDLNGTRAAIAAGYASSGAHVSASQLIRNIKVKRLIEKLQTKRASRLEITAERLDEETAKLAFANMGDYVGTDENGKPVGIDLSRLTPEQWAAVQEIREDTTGGSGDGERKAILRTTLKLADKTAALQLLYKRFGLLKDVTEHKGLEGLAEQLAEMRARKQSTIDPRVIDVIQGVHDTPDTQGSQSTNRLLSDGGRVSEPEGEGGI